MEKTYRVYGLTALVLILIFLGGCTGKSAPTRFYLLESTPQDPDSHTVSVDMLADQNHVIKVGLGPFKIPPYLDRPQMVTRTAPNRLKLMEFDNWAEPLKDTISRLTLERLSTLLNRDGVIVLSWDSRARLDYQVPIEVIRLDNTPGKDALLAARWEVIRNPDKALVLIRTSRYTQESGIDSPEAFAAAQSRNLESLCRDMADALRQYKP
ncbi:MAG: membrane integrity-associated transporter subunit PqiC [Desulfobacteraceae bacterium]|nr:MAG: membrane integrity-associated transporter subunit PqiC [Desulfobacteraceae bacterium]